MEYIYMIKLADGSGGFSRPTLYQNIIEAENKQQVCDYIQEHHPEYFDGNKVAQKLTKKSEQLVYVTIFELDDYWKGYWTQDCVCKVCGKTVPLIQVKNMDESLSNPYQFACSLECKEKLPEVLQELREAASEEYWNQQRDYYYIYKITHKLTGRCYIGYTAREVVFRWWEHVKHSDLPIGQALQAELEMFTFEILEKHEKSTKTIQEMHQIETMYIQKYNSIEDGYNCVVSASTDTTPKAKPRKLFDDSL